MDITLNIKNNKGGTYISLLVVNTSVLRGHKSTCIPMGKNFEGWRSFLSALEWSLNINPGINRVEIQRKESVEKVVAIPVSNSVVEEFRNKFVILSSP